MKLEDGTVTVSSITFPSQNRTAVQQRIMCLTWNFSEGNFPQQIKIFPTRNVIRGVGQLRTWTYLGDLMGGKGIGLQKRFVTSASMARIEHSHRPLQNYEWVLMKSNLCGDSDILGREKGLYGILNYIYPPGR